MQWKFSWYLPSLHGQCSRSILPKQNETTSELNSNQRDSSEVILQSNCLTDTVVVEDDSPLFNLTAKEDKSTSSVAEEWEQLVVNGAPEIFSSPCFSKPKTDILVLSSPVSSKELEIRTSRILERLEVPRKLKTKVTSPIVTGSILTTCLPTKRPLIPFQQPSQATDQSLTSSQLLRPNFQRIKRKIKWKEGCSYCGTDHIYVVGTCVLFPAVLLHKTFCCMNYAWGGTVEQTTYTRYACACACACFLLQSFNLKHFVV